MPKNRVQTAIFTIMMVLVMVYGMICYNITLEVGGLSNFVFLEALPELAFMGPIAFLLDMLVVSPIVIASRGQSGWASPLRPPLRWSLPSLR